MKKKYAILLAMVLAAVMPSWAVFKEENLHQTLSVLMEELKDTYERVDRSSGWMEKRIVEQHERLVRLIDECNELSVMLYSQEQVNTFDQTFALNEVTQQYHKFSSNRVPFNEIIDNMHAEMERYNRLVLTLRKMPPERTAEEIEQAHKVEVALDSVSEEIADTVVVDTPDFAKESMVMAMDDETAAIRDSCLFYAEQMVAYYWQQIQHVEQDNEYYQQTDELLKSAYDYAQERYSVLQHKVFVEGQGNYLRTLKSFSFRYRRAITDLKARYGLNRDRQKNAAASSWRGPVVFAYAFMLLFILALSILIANVLVRISVKWVKWFQGEWSQQHRGMLIALTGVVFFSIFLLINSNTAGSSFIVRSSVMMGEYTWLLAAIFASMLIRLDKPQVKKALMGYLPMLILAFLIIFFRIVFIPNSAINLFFPLLVLVFALWQVLINIKTQETLPRGDKVMMWVGAVIMVSATLLSWWGMVMGALLLMIWWMFQLALLESIIAVSKIVDRYYSSHEKEWQRQYRQKNPALPISTRKESYIEVFWLRDLLDMAVVPLLTVGSVPAAIYMACNVFNFNIVAQNIFLQPLLNIEGYLQLSLFKIVLTVGLYFVFRFVIYATKGFYRVWRTRAAVGKLDAGVVFKESDINFNLANNIVTLLVWGLYVIIVFSLMKIPASGLTLVTTGLATGVGFAMKDILNNFFYGIQLMSGRVRVGDIVECDGVRGTVAGLSYQSTQIEASDGSMIIFTNSTLFNKNFKNLTRNHSYEMLHFTVGVKYGTDVEKAREVIVEALQPLMVKDKYGREIVDRKKGVSVRLLNFGDSSVDLQVLLHTTVDSHFTFAAQAKEAIYKAFAEHDIEIPFPQQDLYIKEIKGGQLQS
ncbi:MAG: mechanosensitive ion channel [Bacteroidales bacterium]|nr:mechanosensitive ion channel [Bacteroidales bacterium]